MSPHGSESTISATQRLRIRRQRADLAGQPAPDLVVADDVRPQHLQRHPLLAGRRARWTTPMPPSPSRVSRVYPPTVNPGGGCWADVVTRRITRGVPGWATRSTSLGAISILSDIILCLICSRPRRLPCPIPPAEQLGAVSRGLDTVERDGESCAAHRGAHLPRSRRTTSGTRSPTPSASPGGSAVPSPATCGSAAATRSRATPAARSSTASRRGRSRITWEYGGQVSWVDVTLTDRRRPGPGCSSSTRRRSTRSMWEEFGPGAVGIGWEIDADGPRRAPATPPTPTRPRSRRGWRARRAGPTWWSS